MIGPELVPATISPRTPWPASCPRNRARGARATSPPAAPGGRCHRPSRAAAGRRTGRPSGDPAPWPAPHPATCSPHPAAPSARPGPTAQARSWLVRVHGDEDARHLEERRHGLVVYLAGQRECHAHQRPDGDARVHPAREFARVRARRGEPARRPGLARIRLGRTTQQIESPVQVTARRQQVGARGDGAREGGAHEGGAHDGNSA